MTLSDEHEAAVWEQARAGDPTAFGRIFDLHHARIFRQARRLTESVADAEDVTALVFLEAWRKRETVRVVDGSVVAWLAVTTGHLARNSSRSRNRHRALLAKLHESAVPTTSPDHADDVSDRLDRQAAMAVVREALARLPRRDRDVLMLCVVQGLPARDAADALGVAPGTIKSRLSRARSRLSAAVLADLAMTPTNPGGAR